MVSQRKAGLGTEGIGIGDGNPRCLHPIPAGQADCDGCESVTRRRSPESRRLLTLGPDNDPPWVRLYVRQIDEVCAAMLLADDVAPPEPGGLQGLAFFGATPEEAERAAKVALGCSEPGT